MLHQWIGRWDGVSEKAPGPASHASCSVSSWQNRIARQHFASLGSGERKQISQFSVGRVTGSFRSSRKPSLQPTLSLCHSTYHLDFSQAARSELGTPKQIRLLIHSRPIDPLCPPDFASSPQSCPSFSVAAQVSTSRTARSLTPPRMATLMEYRTRPGSGRPDED
jgi:hypothetical protein